MDYEEPKKPPNTLVLSNAVLRYLQRANTSRGFESFEQTTLYSCLALYNRLIAGMELMPPAQKAMKGLYLGAAIDEVSGRIQSMAEEAQTPEERRAILPKLEQWSDVLMELNQALEELN